MNGHPCPLRPGLIPWAFRPRTLIETQKHSLSQIVENFGDLDFVTNLPKVKCRVHIAAGRFDPVAPSFYAQQVHRDLEARKTTSSIVMLP